jgi:hypothetical protein
MKNILVVAAGAPHHRKNVGGEGGRMGVFIGIGISVVKPVHNGIRFRAHVGRTLRHPRKYKKETLPAFAHGKCTMCCVPMLEKCLKKKRHIPKGNEENEYCHLVIEI